MCVLPWLWICLFSSFPCESSLRPSQTLPPDDVIMADWVCVCVFFCHHCPPNWGGMHSSEVIESSTFGVSVLIGDKMLLSWRERAC
uniref:Putative secreted protein n=1 Tax=Anopheles marajoara TaxID=58244 RepID=A0A2M4CBQ9_9DIPT